MEPTRDSHYGRRATPEVDLRAISRVLVRRRTTFFGILVLALVVGVLVTHLQPRMFESSATVRIEEEQPQLSLLSRLAPVGLGAVAGLASSDIQTDMAVLRSRQIAEGIVDSLALHVRLLEPDTSRAAVLHVLSAQHTAEDNVYELRLQEGGEYTVWVGGKKDPSAPARVEFGRSFHLGAVSLALRPEIAANPPERIRIRVQPFRRRVEEVRKVLRVERPDPTAQVVAIRFTDPDPILAAAVPNIAMAGFIRFKQEMNRGRSSSKVDFLQEQTSEYQRALARAESNLRSFRERAQVISPKDQASEQVRRFAELQAERNALQLERQSLGRLLARIESSSSGADGRSPYRELASYPKFLSNGAVQGLLEALTQLENQRAELLVRQTAQHVDVQGLTHRIEEIELQLRQIAMTYLRSLGDQVEALDSALAQFDAQLATIPAREVEFVRLGREQKLLEEVYTLLQTKLKEEEIQAAADVSNVRVIDAALVPLDPISPRPVLNLIIAAILGLVGAAGLVFAREVLDTRVQTREDVQRLAAGIPVLGAVPRTRPAPALGRVRRGKSVLPLSRSDTRLLLPAGPEHSRTAEVFRTLRTTLALGEHPPHLVVVTGALLGDGASGASANLAASFARQGVRTALVDADLRDGELHHALGVETGPGLADVVQGAIGLEEAVRQVPLETAGATLHFLSVGMAADADALLGTARMRQLFEDLRNHYDVVVIDTPPVGLFADAAVLGSLADATLLVIRMGATDQQALHAALERLSSLQVAVRGVIVTDADDREWHLPRQRNGVGRRGWQIRPL